VPLAGERASHRRRDRHPGQWTWRRSLEDLTLPRRGGGYGEGTVGLEVEANSHKAQLCASWVGVLINRSPTRRQLYGIYTDLRCSAQMVGPNRAVVHPALTLCARIQTDQISPAKSEKRLTTAVDA
jgi:hypothetical protein